ncbi:glutamine amidotransferase-related protein, partial [Staphylococcus epidermidis]
PPPNHPVKHLTTPKIHITTQNHPYSIDSHSLKNTHLQLTHIPLNHPTLQALTHKQLPPFSLQYHPQPTPAPTVSNYLFDDFISRINH